MNLILGITGGISAYKSAELVRILVKNGITVRVVMTPAAKKFITPLTFQALSGHTVYTNAFVSEESAGMDHIHLARWADFILIAPASADFIARLAQGHANDLLSMLCLAAEIPIAVAPAMNQRMWLNLATQANLALLKQRELLIFGPAEGEQACGEWGLGRLLEPLELLSLIKQQYQISALIGKKIVITAGPTREFIDPIRYLTNCSTGIMGYSIAESAAYAGAQVTLISGPTQLPQLGGAVDSIFVDSALDMQAAVHSYLKECDIFIAAAAISDYRPESISLEKIKKTEVSSVLKLVRNPDILLEISQLESRPFIVGFAAETHSLLKNAQKKLKEKKLDMIIANQVGKNHGFGEGDTSVTILTREGDVLTSPKQSKKVLSRFLVQKITQFFSAYSLV